MTEKAQLNPFVKLALDIGPLILFFVVNGKAGIFAATGAFMVAVIVALVVSYVLIRRFPVMTVVSAIIVMVFGGLTIFLHDDTFIKLKPTLIYLLFAGVLAGLVGLRFEEWPREARFAAATLIPLTELAAGLLLITPAARSPWRWIGLGLVARGRERHGEIVRAHDPLRGEDYEVELCSPIFYDPEGGRQRA